MELKWTDKKPTEIGWYWRRSKHYNDEIVYVRLYCGELCINNWGVPDGSEWAGPISVPT